MAACVKPTVTTAAARIVFNVLNMDKPPRFVL
jgi:hypothetical protein